MWKVCFARRYRIVLLRIPKGDGNAQVFLNSKPSAYQKFIYILLIVGEKTQQKNVF
jgi:hypothetical protein